MKKLFFSVLGLALAANAAHAQAGRKMYVNSDAAFVYANPLKPAAQKYGYLRAGDSVQVSGQRLPEAGDSFGIGKQYVSVSYPAYATVPAGGGWLSRKFLTSRRDSITESRRLTREEAEQLRAKRLAELKAGKPGTF